MYNYTIAEDKGLNTDGYMQDRAIGSTNNDEQFFGVFDGHGFEKSTKHLVDFVSENIKDILWDERKKENNSKQFLLNLFSKIQELSIKENLEGGTTTSLLFFDREGKHWSAYVGDSPIYGINDDQITDIIGRYNYHNVRNILMNDEEQRFIEYYDYLKLRDIVLSHSIDGLNLTRALGDNDYSHLSHIPDIKQIKQIFDRYLITSDGIFDKFKKEFILEIIQKKDSFLEGAVNIIQEYNNRIKHIYRTAEEGDLDGYYYDNAIVLGAEKNNNSIQKKDF